MAAVATAEARRDALVGRLFEATLGPKKDFLRFYRLSN
jgi:hypothetical protein